MMSNLCDTTDCTDEAVAVVKDDNLNGHRCCPDCLEDEGRQRGWW